MPRFKKGDHICHSKLFPFYGVVIFANESWVGIQGTDGGSLGTFDATSQFLTHITQEEYETAQVVDD